MATRRKNITKKTRFEVFKRDSFTCQYCGKQAPEVVLQVDHIKPVAGGGDNDILNLVTSCIDCNLGKGAKELSDDSIIAKQKRQLEELNEKRLQLEMLIDWRESISDMGNTQAEYIEKVLFGGTKHKITETGKNKLKQLFKRYSFEEVCQAAEISRLQYAEYAVSNDATTMTETSANKVFDYVSRIAAVKRREDEHPATKDLLYIRGIVRNRMYCNEQDCFRLLRDAYERGVSIDTLKKIAKTSRSWTDWKDEMWEVVEDAS